MICLLDVNSFFPQKNFLLQGGPLKTTVTGVEMFKKILDHGQVNG